MLILILDSKNWENRKDVTGYKVWFQKYQLLFQKATNA